MAQFFIQRRFKKRWKLSPESVETLERNNQWCVKMKDESREGYKSGIN